VSYVHHVATADKSLRYRFKDIKFSEGHIVRPPSFWRTLCKAQVIGFYPAASRKLLCKFERPDSCSEAYLATRVFSFSGIDGCRRYPTLETHIWCCRCSRADAIKSRLRGKAALSLSPQCVLN
jgi:hypothetical protein